MAGMPAPLAFLLVGVAGLFGLTSILSPDKPSKREETLQQSVLFKVNNTGIAGGSVPAETWHNGLHVVTSRNETDDAAIFSSLRGDTLFPGLFSGFPTIGHNGIMGGDFAIPNPDDGALEPLTGTWISVHESADCATKNAFKIVSRTVEAMQKEESLEEILSAAMLLAEVCGGNTTVSQ